MQIQPCSTAACAVWLVVKLQRSIRKCSASARGNSASACPPNKGLERTALCARKIAAILRPGLSPKVVSIYWCAAAQAQAVGRQPSNVVLAAIVIGAKDRLSLVASRVAHYPASAGWRSLAATYAPIACIIRLGMHPPGSACFHSSRAAACPWSPDKGH
jgi:hypothetical protein